MDSRATNLQNLIATIREDTHKKIFFWVVGPLRGGGSKTPLTTKQKNLFFFYDLKKKIPELHKNKN